MPAFTRMLLLAPFTLPPVAAMAQSSPPQLIAALPCPVLINPAMQSRPSSQWLPFDDRRPDAPVFGIAPRDWTDEAFEALKQRVRQCGSETDPRLRPTITTLLGAIGMRQSKQAVLNEGLQRQDAGREAMRTGALAELDRIQKLGDADRRLADLSMLDMRLGMDFPEIHDAIATAQRAARQLRVQQQASIQQAAKLAEAEQELRNRAQAVAQEEEARRQRQQAAGQSVAAQAAQARELALLEERKTADIARLQQIEQEKAALDERATAQAAQRAADDLATARRVAAVKDTQAKADQARSAAEQVKRERSSAEQVVAAKTAELAEQAAVDAEVETFKNAMSQAVASRGGAVDQLGVSAAYLNAEVMMLNPFLRPIPPVTLRQYLAMLSLARPETAITGIHVGRYEGVRLKVPGKEAVNLLWRLDTDELYPVGIGTGDRVFDLTDSDSKDQRDMLGTAVRRLAETIASQAPAKR